jgi:hypothetical protein
MLLPLVSCLGAILRPGAGVLVGVAVGLGVLVGSVVHVGVGVLVGVTVGLGVPETVGVIVGVDVAVGVTVNVGVAVNVGVTVLVGVLVGVDVLVGVIVNVGVTVGVGVAIDAACNAPGIFKSLPPLFAVDRFDLIEAPFIIAVLIEVADRAELAALISATTPVT